MSQTVRMLSPPTQKSVTLPSGVVFKSSPGQAIDVAPEVASVLEGNGFIRIALSGPTTGRPTSTLPASGAPFALTTAMSFFDSTLGKVIAFDGQTWRDPATGNAV